MVEPIGRSRAPRPPSGPESDKVVALDPASRSADDRVGIRDRDGTSAARPNRAIATWGWIGALIVLALIFIVLVWNV